MNPVFNKLHQIFEAEPTVNLRTMLEIPENAWEELQAIAAKKQYKLTDMALQSSDNKTLVTADTEEPWQQIVTYLDMPDLMNEPLRTLSPSTVRSSITSPSATQKEVRITAQANDNDMPTEEELREVINANLKPLDKNVAVQGKIEVTKADGTYSIKFNLTVPPDTDEKELATTMKQNLDKVFQISALDIK